MFSIKNKKYEIAKELREIIINSNYKINFDIKSNLTCNKVLSETITKYSYQDYNILIKTKINDTVNKEIKYSYKGPIIDVYFSMYNNIRYGAKELDNLLKDITIYKEEDTNYIETLIDINLDVFIFKLSYFITADQLLPANFLTEYFYQALRKQYE